MRVTASLLSLLYRRSGLALCPPPIRFLVRCLAFHPLKLSKTLFFVGNSKGDRKKLNYPFSPFRGRGS